MKPWDFNVPETEVHNKPLCAGILQLAREEMEESPEWYKDLLEIRGGSMEEKSAAAEKITSAMMVMTINLEMKMLGHLDKQSYNPERAVLSAAGVAICVSYLISLNLRSMIESEGVNCSEDITEQIVRVFTVPFPLFSDEKKREIARLGLRFLKTIVESDVRNAVGMRDSIRTLTIGYVVNQTRGKTENQQFVNAFCSIAEKLYNAIE